MSDLLADATAELYQADPEAFMPRRAELVAQAREAGEAAAAKQIGALRKPTRSAWVVNRLVRNDPGVRDRLAELAAELRVTGASMDGGRIRELTAARARLVDELTRQAFDDLPAPPAPSAKTKKSAVAEPSAERERRHREKIISAERAVAEADRAADAANAAEQQLQDAVRRMEAELAQARQRLAEARRQAYRAESQQRRAGETLSRLRG